MICCYYSIEVIDFVLLVNSPHYCAVDQFSHIFVTDNNHIIKVVSFGGGTYSQQTIVGFSEAGNVDGIGTLATLDVPLGIVVSPIDSTQMFVYNSNYYTLRYIHYNGVYNVTTLYYNLPLLTDLVIDSMGSWIYAGSSGWSIYKISLHYNHWVELTGLIGAGSFDGILSTARFSYPSGLSIDMKENLYVTDVNNNLIRFINVNSSLVNVQTIAGINKQSGKSNSLGILSTFNYPFDIVSSMTGETVLITDYYNAVIRQISCTAGYYLSYGECLIKPIYSLEYVNNIIVSTFVGNHNYGNVDGTAKQVEFQYPQGLCINPNETFLVVVDKLNNTIHQIDMKTTFTARIGHVHSFYNPNYCVVDTFNSIYITEECFVSKIPSNNLNIAMTLVGHLYLCGKFILELLLFQL